LGDRIGRKPVLFWSVAAFGLFSIMTALAQDYHFFLFARLLAGFGFGGTMPNVIAIATEISRPERRAGVMTAMFCGMPTGGSCVSLLALSTELDWRALFLIGGILPMLLLPAIHFLLPETRPVRSADADIRILRGLFGEKRTLPTLLLWLVYALTLVVLYLMLNWLPTLVIDKGFTPADGSAAAMAYNLTSIAGSLLLGWAADRVGYRWPLTIAYLLLAFAVWSLANTSALGAVLILSGLAGALVIGAQYTLYALAPIYYPEQIRAAGAGAAVSIGRVGSVIGPLLAGGLRGAGYTPDQVFLTLVPLILVTAAAIFALTTLRKPS